MIIDRVYKVSAFGDFSDIKPTSENMMFLLENFKEYGFIPTLTTEYNITASMDGSQAPVQNQLQRMALVSNDNAEQIIIGTNRIDYVITTLYDIKFGEADFEEFDGKIRSAFLRILQHFNKKSNRLALNTESLVFDLSDQEVAKVMSNFSNPLSLYQSELDEWNTHFMIRCDKTVENEEKINVITNISKITYSKLINEENISNTGFILQADINTLAEHTSQRFSGEHIQAFVSVARNLWNTVVQEVEDLYAE